MFDLERAISDWRRQLFAAGIEPSEILELECHLREEIERLVKSGLSEQNAIEDSVRQIGHPQLLKNEFNKSERNIMKHILVIGAGILAVLVGVAFVMPAVAQYRHTGAMSNDEPWLFLLGSLLVLAGIGAAWVGARRRLA